MPAEPPSQEVTGCELPTVAQAFEPLIEAVPEEKRRLGGFILLALAAHVLAFLFLQVVTIQPFITPSPRISVSLATPELAGPELRANLDYWRRVHDPSLLIIPRDPLLEDIRLDHGFTGSSPAGEWNVLTIAEDKAQSYNILPTGLLPLEERVAEDLLAPPSRDFRPAALSTPATEDAATLVNFAPALQKRLLGSGPRLATPALPALTLERGTTDLRLAVTADGRVRHVLVDKTSGNSEVDRQAVTALRAMRFQRADGQPLTWGTARVFWHFTAP